MPVCMCHAPHSPQLGDCWLMSAFACMAEHPGLLQNLFMQREYNPRGKYQVSIIPNLCSIRFRRDTRARQHECGGARLASLLGEAHEEMRRRRFVVEVVVGSELDEQRLLRLGERPRERQLERWCGGGSGVGAIDKEDK